MIECLTCGNKYPQGTKYCLGCGRVIDIQGNNAKNQSFEDWKEKRERELFEREFPTKELITNNDMDYYLCNYNDLVAVRKVISDYNSKSMSFIILVILGDIAMILSLLDSWGDEKDKMKPTILFWLIFINILIFGLLRTKHMKVPPVPKQDYLKYTTDKNYPNLINKKPNLENAKPTTSDLVLDKSSDNKQSNLLTIYMISLIISLALISIAAYTDNYSNTIAMVIVWSPLGITFIYHFMTIFRRKKPLIDYPLISR